MYSFAKSANNDSSCYLIGPCYPIQTKYKPFLQYEHYILVNHSFKLYILPNVRHVYRNYEFDKFQNSKPCIMLAKF